MSTEQNSRCHDDFMDSEQEELQRIISAYQTSFRKRLLAFFVRWTVGFGLIAFLVYFKPEWYWLWWVGLCIAGLSFAFLLVSHFVMRRKTANLQRNMILMQQIMHDYDNDDDDCDSGSDDD